MTDQDQAQAESPITRTVGYTKDDGTTDTYEAFIGPDGNILKYEPGSVLVIPEFERRLNAARDSADQAEIEDISAEYQDAREAKVRRLHDRAQTQEASA